MVVLLLIMLTVSTMTIMQALFVAVSVVVVRTLGPIVGSVASVLTMGSRVLMRTGRRP